MWPGGWLWFAQCLLMVFKGRVTFTMAELCTRFLSWNLVKILKMVKNLRLKFDKDLEAVISLISSYFADCTQPLNPLCLWQCLYQSTAMPFMLYKDGGLHLFKFLAVLSWLKYCADVSVTNMQCPLKGPVFKHRKSCQTQVTRKKVKMSDTGWFLKLGPPWICLVLAGK